MKKLGQLSVYFDTVCLQVRTGEGPGAALRQLISLTFVSELDISLQNPRCFLGVQGILPLSPLRGPSVELESVSRMRGDSGLHGRPAKSTR